MLSISPVCSRAIVMLPTPSSIASIIPTEKDNEQKLNILRWILVYLFVYILKLKWVHNPTWNCLILPNTKRLIVWKQLGIPTMTRGRYLTVLFLNYFFLIKIVSTCKCYSSRIHKNVLIFVLSPFWCLERTMWCIVSHHQKHGLKYISTQLLYNRSYKCNVCNIFLAHKSWLESSWEFVHFPGWIKRAKTVLCVANMSLFRH